MDFLGNQTGVAKKNNINVIRLVPARIESGRGRKSLGWRATSEKGREKGNSLGWRATSKVVAFLIFRFSKGKKKTKS